MKKIIGFVGVAGAALVLATPASAATALFDFGTGNGTLNAGTYTASSGGLSLTVQGFNNLSAILNQVSFSSQANVTQASSGLGVAGNGSDQINDGGLLQLGEGLLLTFDREVTLTQALFGNFGASDEVKFEFGSPIAAGEWLDTLVAPGGTWTGSRVGSQFFFAANNGDLFGPGDSFRLKSLNVNFAAPVPEPATWAMMLIGMAAVGGLMRRRQRQTVRYDFA